MEGEPHFYMAGYVRDTQLIPIYNILWFPVKNLIKARFNNNNTFKSLCHDYVLYK